MTCIRCSNYLLWWGAHLLAVEEVSTSGWHVSQRQAQVYWTYTRDEQWEEQTFAGSVVWPGGWIVHPIANTGLFLRKRNTVLLQTLFGEAHTHLLLLAGLTKPGYCHCKWFFHMCQHDHTETEMSVTLCLPLRWVFCLWQGSLCLRPATSRRTGVCWQRQPPMACVPHHRSSSPALPELDQSEFKSISRGWNQRAGTGIQFTLPELCVMFSSSKSEYVLG